MKTVISVIVATLAMTTAGHTQQYLAPGPSGMRYYQNYSGTYDRGPYYRGANPGPYYRGVSPGPYYRGGVSPGPYYRGDRRSDGGRDIGDVIGGVIGTVMQNAMRPRYVPPQPVYATAQPVEAPAPQQRRAPTQDQWRQSLLAGAAAFCRQYPTDQFCGPADQPAEVAPEPPTASPPVQTAPMPVEPPTGSAPARPYLQR